MGVAVIAGVGVGDIVGDGVIVAVEVGDGVSVEVGLAVEVATISDSVPQADVNNTNIANAHRNFVIVFPILPQDF